jgi:hypothetical protein
LAAEDVKQYEHILTGKEAQINELEKLVDELKVHSLAFIKQQMPTRDSKSYSRRNQSKHESKDQKGMSRVQSEDAYLTNPG